MRYDLAAASRDWELLELVYGDDHVCSDAYADAEVWALKRVGGELRKLRAAGCPPERTLGNPKVEAWTGACSGDHHETRFWVLKTTPAEWRLYFAQPDPQQQRLIFLLAVAKKSDKRNPKDFDKCCTRLREYLAGEAEAVELFIPAR